MKMIADQLQSEKMTSSCILWDRAVVCGFLRPDSMDISEDAAEQSFVLITGSGSIYVSTACQLDFVENLDFQGSVLDGVQTDVETCVMLSDQNEIAQIDLRTLAVSSTAKLPSSLVRLAPLHLVSWRGRTFISGFMNAYVEIDEEMEICVAKISGVCVDVAASDELGPVFLVETPGAQEIFSKVSGSKPDFSPIRGERIFCVDRKLFVFSDRELAGYDGEQWRRITLPMEISSEENSDPPRSMPASLIVDRAVLNLGLSKPKTGSVVERKFLQKSEISCAVWNSSLLISDQRGGIFLVGTENFQVNPFQTHPDFPFPCGGKISVLPGNLLLSIVRDGPVLVTDLKIGNFFSLKFPIFSSQVLEIVNPEISLSFGPGQPAGRFSAIFQHHCQSEIASWDFQLPCLPLRVSATGSVARLEFPDGNFRAFEISDDCMREFSDHSGQKFPISRQENVDFSNLGLSESPESVVRWNRKLFVGTRDGNLLIFSENKFPTRKKRKRDESPRLSPSSVPPATLEQKISVGTRAVGVFLLEDAVVAISDSVVVVRKFQEFSEDFAVSRVPLGVEVAHAVPIGNLLGVFVVTPSATCHLFRISRSTETAEYHLQLPFNVISGFRSEISGNFHHFVLLAYLEEARTTALVRAVVDERRLGAHGLDEALEISGALAMEGLSAIVRMDAEISVVCTRDSRLLALDVSRNFQVLAKAVLEEPLQGGAKFLRGIGNNLFLVGSSEAVAVVKLLRLEDGEDVWEFHVVACIATQFPIVDAVCQKYGNSFQILLAYQHQGCSLWEVDDSGSRKLLGEISMALSDVKKLIPMKDDSRVYVTFGDAGIALLNGFDPDDNSLLNVEILPNLPLASPVTAFVEDERKLLLATASGGLIAITK